MCCCRDVVCAGAIRKELGALSKLRQLYLNNNRLTGNVVWGDVLQLFGHRLLERESCHCVGEQVMF